MGRASLVLCNLDLCSTCSIQSIFWAGGLNSVQQSSSSSCKIFIPDHQPPVCTGRMLFKSHPSYSWACPMCWRCGRRGANRAPTHAARPVGKKSHTTRGVDICDSQIWTPFIKSKKLMSIYLCSSVHLQNSLSQNGDWCWCCSVIPLVLPVEHIRPWCFPYVYLKSLSIPQSRIRTCLVLVCWDSCDFWSVALPL